MPQALLALPDVYESVTRRVAVDVTAQLARLMRLPGDTTVYLPGHAETVPMNGGTFGDCYDTGVKYPAGARLVVRYNEEADESFTLTTPVNNTQNMVIFEDPIRGITIRPVYRFVTFTVTLEYTAPSQVVAQRWSDEMRSRISMGRAEIYQDLEYHYALPDSVIAILQMLYETMEASAFPTGQTLEQWVVANFRHPTKILTTLVDTDKTVAIPEHQHGVLGWFDFTTTPPPADKDSDGNGTFTSSINFQLQYNRPTQVYVKYPFLVHQKPIPRLYRDKTPFETFRGLDRKISSTQGSLGMAMELMQAQRLPYLHHPNTDDWTTSQIPNGRLTFYSGLLALPATDLRTVMDLSNLGDMRFSPYFLEYFYHQQSRLFGPDSIFEFRLYENDDRRYDIAFEMIPGTVTFRTNKDLDPTKYYHVQISFKRDWYMLNRDTIACLKRYPHVAYWSLRALGVRLGKGNLNELALLGTGRPRQPSDLCPGEGTSLGVFPWLPRPDYVLNTGVVKQRDLDTALLDLDNISRKPVDWNRIGPMTVMYLEILTEKKVTK
jgi:hypothetical protein